MIHLFFLTSWAVAISLALVEAAEPFPHSTDTPLILLDIDNTLYQEKHAGIEEQIVRNTHSFCQESLSLSKDQADDLYRTYGSTIEGLRQTTWKDLDDRALTNKLREFYENVYKGIDKSKLLLSSKVTNQSTGYSHTSAIEERRLLSKLLKSCPRSLCISSNSPSWHVEKVLQAMGMNSIRFVEMFTPDKFSSFPTKHSPNDFFAGSALIQNPSTKLWVLDDSTHNLDRIFAEYSVRAEFSQITADHTLAQALLQRLDLVDEQYDMDPVRYLESKNLVDRLSLNADVWNAGVIKHLRRKSNTDPRGVMVVDVGAGLLSMLDVLLHGDSQNGLEPLEVDPASGARIQYTAFESNTKLYSACHEQLTKWGFDLIESKELEYAYQKRNWRVSLILRDFDDGDESDCSKMKPPDLVLGCCFADLFDPKQLVPSLYHRFGLLEANDTLLYFPITFCGITQFLPPWPFTDRIPSDTLAFQTYAKTLSEDMGHHLDPSQLEEILQGYGASLQRRVKSDWKIDSQQSPYLYETMLYFFGTSAGPTLLHAGWDARGWIQRARVHKPTIQVSNVDLLFRLGDQGGTLKEGMDSNTTNSYREILFTGPRKVTSTEKSIPRLAPTQVLIKTSYSLISSGTELKIFKGMFEDAALDVNIKGMDEERMAYPLAYGYCLVGTVSEIGNDVDPALKGKLVFTFSAHSTHVVADVDAIQIVPDGVDAREAIFMPSVETALSLVHDAHVRVGENVAVYGQGLIGLLVTAILNLHAKDLLTGEFGRITVFDTIPDRLAAASLMGASQALFPGGCQDVFDVAIEVSGNSRALQAAIDHTSNGGRIIIGSWYGNEAASLKLGIDFHRSHKTIQTSQVSEIPATLLGLWDKKRRFELTWELVRQLRPSRLLTRTVSLAEAQEAYEALDEGSEIAVAFKYC